MADKRIFTGQSGYFFTMPAQRSSARFTGFSPRGLPIISEVSGLAWHGVPVGATVNLHMRADGSTYWEKV